MQASQQYWIVHAPTTKAGGRSVHPWQIRERDGTPEGPFRSAFKTEAAAIEICDFLNKAYERSPHRRHVSQGSSARH
jgi:hypothetical protein